LRKEASEAERDLKNTTKEREAQQSGVDKLKAKNIKIDEEMAANNQSLVDIDNAARERF
jgi:hypothetical protein